MVAANATSGISEKVELNLESTYGDGGLGADITKMLIKKLTWNADSKTSPDYSVTGTGIANNLMDEALGFSGTMDTYLTDGRELKLAVGSITDLGAGTFSLAVANALPSFGFIAVNDSGTSDNVTGSGFKVSKATIKGSRGNKVDVSYTIVGKNVIESVTAISVGTSTTKPFLDLDTVMTINNGIDVDLENWELTIDRGTETRRGIVTTTALSKRLISAAIEKKLSVTGKGTAIADKLIFRALMGGTTLTDYRTAATIVITLANATNTIIFTTTGLISMTGRNSGAEDNLMIMNFNFTGKSIAVTGTY